MKVQATLNNYRRSSKKIKETARVIRGLDCSEALSQLELLTNKDAQVLKKLIASAMANAANNFQLDKHRLFVDDIVIGAGPTMKRWRARAYGRAASILKRTSQITVIVDEKKTAEGKADKKETVKPETANSEVAKAPKAKKEEKKEAPKKESKKEDTKKDTK